MGMTMVDRLYTHTEYVRCRTFGHAWDEVPVMVPDAYGRPQFWLRCTRCTTERHDVVNGGSGWLEAREYVYPEEYSLTGEAVPTRDELRLKLLSIAADLADRRDKRRQRKAS